jgi:uncharacterized protein YkwD
MGKGLFWTFFLVAWVTSALGEKPDLPPPVPDQQQRIDRMFDLTNRLRAARKIPILGLDARLCHAAALHAEEMCRYNYISGGSPDVASVLKSWLSSRAHARILMDPQYYDAGIGLARGATRTYWVLMLATRPSNSSPGRSWGLR